MVDVLRGRGDVGLCLDRSSEGFDDSIGGDIERDEIVVLSALLVVDGECDTPASGQPCALAVVSLLFVHCHLEVAVCIVRGKMEGKVCEGAGSS